MLHNPYSMHYFEVPNPHVPYEGDIPNGLVPGKQIFISGDVPNHSHRFAINLETSHGTAFHFNPRFDEHCIVRNTKVHGSWGQEERHGSFPFHHGQHFEIIIACEEDRFKIAVNGVHVLDYHHRQAYHEISHIKVYGEVNIHKLVFSGNHHHANEHQHLHPPFSVPLHGINPGKMIHIKGFIHHHTNRFNVHLQDGPGEASNIALTLSIRFDDPYTGSAFVRTNRQHGSWGPEDRHGDFPFHKGAPFELLILCEAHEWKVAVNGRHFTEFHHRNSLFDANHISVDGNVDIHSIREY